MIDSLFAKVKELAPCDTIQELPDICDTKLHNRREEIARDDWIEWKRLIEENQKLVYSMAWKHMGQGIELSDLIQIGNLGLIKASQKFDPTKGVGFGTYAFYWIQQTIKLALKNQGRIIRIPTHVLDKIKRYYQAQERLYHKLAREPSGSEIAQELYSFEEETRQDLIKLKEGKISLNDLVARQGEREKKKELFKEIEGILQIAQVPLSLDEPQGENEDYQFYESLPDKGIETPEQLCINKCSHQEIRWLLSYLSERERFIIHMRFGFDGEEPYSFQEIAERIGITKQGVRKILVRALEKLKSLSEYFQSA